MSIAEFDHCLRLTHDRHAMQEVDHKSQRVGLTRWIASYILPIGVDAPKVKGQGVIKKATLNFTAKFWWLLVCYHLCLTSADNLLSWDSVELIESMTSSYDINFVAIIRYKMHERAFEETTILPFPCPVQLLCDEVGVLEMLGIE